MATAAAAAAPAFGAVSPAAVCPSCGNVFLEDSRYCRKCGKPRATTIAGSSPKSGGSSTSVMPGGKGIGAINPIGGSALVANGAAVPLQGTGLRALEGSTVSGIYAAQTPADITTSSAGGGGLLGGSTASAWQVGQNASAVGPLGGSVRMAATGSSSSSSYVAAPAPVIGASPGAVAPSAAASVPPGWWPPANPSSYVAPASPCPVSATDASAHLRKAGRKPLAADRVQHGESQVTPSPVKAIPLEVARATMATNQPRQPLGGAEIVASARPISTGELSAGGFLVRNLGRQGEVVDPMAAIAEQPGAESAAVAAEQQRAALERQAAELAAAEQVAAQRAAAERAAMELSVAAERAAAERAAAERALAEQTQRAAAERAAAERAAAERLVAEQMQAAADRAAAERMAAEQAAAQARVEAERRMIAEREAAAAAAEQQAAAERQAAAEKQAALVAAAAAAAAQATAERQAAADRARQDAERAAAALPTTGEAGPLRPASGAPLPSSDYIPMAEVVERRSRPAGAALQTEEALPEVRPGGSLRPDQQQPQKPVQIPDTSWELPARTATVGAVSGGLPQQPPPQQDSFQMGGGSAANPLPSSLGSAAVLGQPGLGLEASGAGFVDSFQFEEAPPPPPGADPGLVLGGSTGPPQSIATTGMEQQHHSQGEYQNYITPYQLERMGADEEVPPPPMASMDDERRFATMMQPPSSLTLPVQSRTGAMPSPFFDTSEPQEGAGTGINPFDVSSGNAIGTNVVASAATAGNVGTMVVGVRYDDDGFPIED